MLRVEPRIQRAIAFITVITIVMDMDVTITLHGTHLPIWMKNVSDALSKTWVICVGNESRMEKGFSVSESSSVSRGILVFVCLVAIFTRSYLT